MTKSLTRFHSAVLQLPALAIALAAPALAAPPEDKPPWVAAIMDRLDTIETMIENQSTDLSGVTQNWDRKLDSTNGDTAPGREGCDSDRFTCLFGDTVVRDNETGLVWDRSPDDSFGPNNDGTLDWGSAVGFCIIREVGGRNGFHLPLQEQLTSLVDAGSALCTGGGPCLPDGHPFLHIRNDSYWSATTNPDSPELARRVRFDTGGLGNSTNKTLAEFNWWCVRGGQTFDGNTHDSLH